MFPNAFVILRLLEATAGLRRRPSAGRGRLAQRNRRGFVTSFPGWYFPRATHIHLKVYPPDFGEEATTQLYLNNEICDEVYAGEHYRHRGPNPTRHNPGDDSPLFSFESGDLWLNVSKSGDGYEATHELGVVFYGKMFGDLTDHYRQD